jgi:hypothetical protein
MAPVRPFFLLFFEILMEHTFCERRKSDYTIFSKWSVNIAGRLNENKKIRYFIFKFLRKNFQCCSLGLNTQVWVFGIGKEHKNKIKSAQ